jgi:membrane-bound serine protease (ClpP class)
MKHLCLILLLILSALPLSAGVSDAELLPTKSEETAQPVSATSPASKAEEPAWGLTVVMLLLGGFLFMFLEIAVIPGFGVTGILGILLLGGGLVTAFLKLSTGMALVATFAAIVGVVLLLLWFFMVFPKTRMGKQFILQTDASSKNGFVAVEDNSAYIGKEGVTVTMLRPSGIAKIDGERVDVMTDGEFVEKGVKVRVTKTRQNTIIVTPVEEEPQS